MNKYIIELDENAKEVVVISLEDGDMWTDTMQADDLEQLNSDYINEHFADLQDTAYQRGLEDGKQTAIGAAELREKLEYQKGFEDGKAQSEKGCEGCMWEGNPYDACEQCSNAYKNLWTAKQKTDEICFGDEIVVNGERGVVVSHENEGSAPIWALLNGYRTPQIVDKNNYAKTGRRFDIDKILEEMRE